MMLFNRAPEIDVREASRLATSGELQLVDVREPAELSQAQVPAARHIPLGQLAGRLRELDRNRPIAFVCRSGNRSAMATRKALKEGYSASNVRGGVIAWARSGLPFTGDSRGVA